MNNYLIEFRFFGKAKKEMKRLIYRVQNKFNLPKKRAVPHITLVGGLTTNNEKKLISDFKQICDNSTLTSFKIQGYGVFKDNRVVFVNIKSSEKLQTFRWELSKKLQPYCKLKFHDYKEKFEFHSTIAMNLDHNKFKQIKNYIESIKEPEFKHFMLRATLLKNGKILREYDFMQRRLLNRHEAKNKSVYKKTMALLKEFFVGDYSSNKNILGLQPNLESIKNPQKVNELKKEKSNSLKDKILEFFKLK